MEPHEVLASTTPVEERLAGHLAAAPRKAPIPPTNTAIAALHELGQVDRAVYRAVAETTTPTLDRPFRGLSRAADRSRLWMAIAAAMAALGGHKVRRAAGAGLAGLAVDSAVVNLGLKLAARRRRPDRDSAGVPAARRVVQPHSTSFPSGHAAAGFAFAHAVAETSPPAGAPLELLAALVGYSRIHTGVHYPGDVVVGSLIGATIGQMVGWGLLRVRPAAPQPAARRVRS
ncbi:MAG: phosphoesterase PA-phosphatase related protein [Frankiales bacterium]|nr:phosphoesterase PA-phosphatase related protein [Frankiales bacterium]